MRPIHPGEVLREEFLLPKGLSAYASAMALQVPAINDSVRERRTVTVDTALRMAHYFGASPDQKHRPQRMGRAGRGDGSGFAQHVAVARAAFPHATGA